MLEDGLGLSAGRVAVVERAAVRALVFEGDGAVVCVPLVLTKEGSRIRFPSDY